MLGFSTDSRIFQGAISLALFLLALQLPGVRTLEAQETDYSGRFRVYTGSGEPASLEEIVRAMDAADAVLVGESHTDPVGHFVEAELFRLAVERYRGGDESGALRTLALSLEMFERDVQYILDEYLQGLITESHFLSSARPWEFYEEDYRAMVELAKEAGIPVIAANAPRRYVNRVSREGRDALGDLPSSAVAFLPPLPYPQPSEAYRAEWNALFDNMSMEDQCPAPEAEEEETEAGAPPEMTMPPHGAAPPAGDSAAGPPAGMPPGEEEASPGGMPSHSMERFRENGVQAQTLWDAAMGHAVATFLDRHPGSLVVHMVGGFHVENHTGTPEKVLFYRPETRNLVVAIQLAQDIDSFDPEEHGGLGDFVVLTDESLDLYIARNCEGEG